MQLSHPAKEAGSHRNAWSHRDPCPLGSVSTSELLLLFCSFFVQPVKCFPFSLYLLFLAITSSFCPFARVDPPPLSTVWPRGGSHLWHLATRYSLVLGSFSLNLWHDANEPQLASTLTRSEIKSWKPPRPPHLLVTSTALHIPLLFVTTLLFLHH